MNNLTKKIVVGLLALSMAFTAVSGVFAQEKSVDSQVKEIEQLASDLGIDADVLLKSMGVEATSEEDSSSEDTSIEGIPSGFTFSENMAQGAQGDAVKYLQILLNTSEDTKVADSGAGSPGNETSYFGPATYDAVVRFQEKYASDVLDPHGLTSGTGYVGASTRAKLNELLGQEGSSSDQPSMSAVLKQLQQLAAALESLQSRLDNLEGQVEGTTQADEGELKTELRADIRNKELKKNETKEVAMYRAEAENSAVTVQRFDVYVKEAVGADKDMTNFRNDINHMALKVGGEVIAEREINRSTIERDDDYIRFSGLNVKVPEGEYKDFVIEVTADDSDDLTGTYNVGPVEDDAIRGIDAANLTIYDGASSYRSFDLTTSTASLEATDVNSPEEGIVQIDDANNTEVELLNFDVTAEDSEMDLETLTFDFFVDGDATWGEASGEYTLEDIYQDVLLYQGGELVDVATVTLTDNDDDDSVTGDEVKSATATFDVEMDLVEDSTENFTVVADVFPMDPDADSALLGKEIKADLTGGSAYAYATEVNESLASTISGKYQALYSVMPGLTLDDQQLTVNTDTTPDTGAGLLEFTMEASGGAITPNYVDFSWDNGTMDDAIISVDGSEVNSVALNYAIDMSGSGHNGADYTAGEYVMETGTSHTGTTQYSVYKVEDIDTSGGANSQSFVVGSEGGTAGTDEILVSATNYAGFANASVGDYVLEDTAFEELTEGQTVTVTIDSVITPSSSGYNRLNVDEIGWTIEDNSTVHTLDSTYDVVDDLETVRKYLSSS